MNRATFNMVINYCNGKKGFFKKEDEMGKKYVCISDSWTVLERKSPKAKNILRMYNRNMHQLP